MLVHQIKIDEDLTNDTLEILKKYTSKIPEHYFGIDRLIFLNSIIKEVSLEENRVLNNFVNYLLRIMLLREASDLELGGFGSEGFVWLRVYGAKNIVSELPKLTYDESGMLILNHHYRKTKIVVTKK